jgi:N-acylneuraminate cytidylyltransferase
VPARAGSVGVKNKNLRMVNGKSLIQTAVDLGISLNCQVVVTTNIKNPLPKKYESSVKVHRRPEDLCSSEAEMIPVIKNVIDALKIEGVVVLLQPTSPLRTLKQLKDVLKIYFTLKPTLCLSVTMNDKTILKNLVKLENKFFPISAVDYMFQNRQSLPEVFRPNGAFYVFDAADFSANSFNLENIAVLEMDEITSLDVDTEVDLEKVIKYAK